MRRANHLLKNDCHLLLFQAIRRGSYVGLRMPAEGRRVNAFYRVCGDHDTWRYCNPDSIEALSHPIFVQQVPQKSQPARLSAQRTTANPQERTFRRLEGHGVKIADQNLALLVSILFD